MKTVKNLLYNSTHFIKTAFCMLTFETLALCCGSAIFAASTQNVSTAPSAQSLSGVVPNWVTVLSGNTLCPPVRNSLGYVAVEEGRMLCAFTQTGDILWQKGLSARLKPFISIGPADMIYIVSREGDLNMLNPTGMRLWTSKTGFSITEAPLSGRDGRIYVRGAKNIACFGINGVCRWNISLEAQDTTLPLTELNDGSLLVFTTKQANGKSIAKKVSPFGEVSDDIVFAGAVVHVAQTQDGTLLAFSDGGVGMCSEKDGTVYSRWAITPGNQGISSATRIVTEGFPTGTAAFITGNPASVVIISTKTGETLSSYTSFYSIGGISYTAKTVQGLVLASNSQATCYTDDGTIVWNVLFPKKQWSSVFATDAGYVAFCTTSWVIEGYRVKQTLGSATASSFRPARIRPYTNVYTNSRSSSSITGPLISEAKAQEMQKSFKNGKFGEKEKDWLSLLSGEMAALNEAWMQQSALGTMEQPWFRTNVAYTERILNLISSIGTAAFQPSLVGLIKRVDDPTIQMWIIRSAGALAYDPDGAILFEIQNLLQKSSIQKNEAILYAICDATFEICRFMGRPAFYAQGKDIISSLFALHYPETIREYARKTLLRFAEIEL